MAITASVAGSARGAIGQVVSRLSRTTMNKILDHSVALLQYHEAHPEVNNGRLGELFGITRQRVDQIIKRDKRDRMVVEYFSSHPRVSAAEVSSLFHISLRRARSLSNKISPSADAPVCPQVRLTKSITKCRSTTPPPA